MEENVDTRNTYERMPEDEEIKRKRERMAKKRRRSGRDLLGEWGTPLQ